MPNRFVFESLNPQSSTASDPGRRTISGGRFGRHRFGLAHTVFLAILTVRLVVLGRLASSPLLLPASGDMYFYNDWARHILQGELTDHLAFYGLPGYAYLLAFLYRIFGYNPFVPALFQAVLDASIGVFIYQLSLRAFSTLKPVRPNPEPAGSRLPVPDQGQIVGLIAALAWATFVPAQAYSVILMPTTWFVCAFWCVVWVLVRKTDPNWIVWSSLGLLIGVVATGVATILILVPIVVANLLWKGWENRRRQSAGLLLKVVIFFAGIVIGTSPCWIHNYWVARDPVFLSAHSGLNFWIGNNPAANGYPRSPPGLRAAQAEMLQDSIHEAERAAGHPLKRSEVSAYWSALARNYIARHFSDWLKLLLLKLGNFWNAFQYDDLSIITNLRQQGVIFAGLYFGVAAAFAIPGMIFGWRTTAEARWIAVATLSTVVVLLPVFITERYRLVAVPGLLIFAAFGLTRFWQALTANNFRSVAVYLALLGGATLFVAWPRLDPSLWALDPYNSGWQALESNRLDFAEERLALAHAYVPDNAETIFALGNLRFAQNNTLAAKAFYRETLRINSQHIGALNNLGVIAITQNNWQDAQSFLRAAANLEPTDAKVHYLLAKALYEQGKKKAAATEIGTAIRLKPQQQEFQQLKNQIESGQP